MQLALFDFDGTITTEDSLIKFIRFSVGDIKTMWGILLLSPMLIIYKLKIIPNYKAKQWMFSYFFKGMDEYQFQKLTEDYSLTHIDTILRPKAMEKIRWHQEKGHTIVVVSASIESWLRPWCVKHNLNLIATKIEIEESVVTGRFRSKNCYGVEKVNRVKEIYNLNDYSYIYAYGDSRGDRELMSLANEKYYQYF
jgi:HAD superfamily hydrolase (TIGR01490 family)